MRGVLWYVVLAGACTHATAPDPTTSRAPVSPRDDSAQALERGSQPAPAAAPAPLPPAVPYFALAKHLERAEIRRDDALLIDYGADGDAKYTFGGWLTGSGGAQELDGHSARVIGGKLVKLTLPADSSGAQTLVMRLRGFRPGPLTVYVNGETVAERQLGGKEFEEVAVALASGALSVGDNTLQLRVARTGSAKGVREAGMALDWIRLGPVPAAGQASGPPPEAELQSVEGGTARLQIPAGLSLGYAFEVPDKAELRARVSGDEGAVLLVSAQRDGAPAHAFARQAAQTPTLRIDLGAVAGELVRLDLRAQGGKVVLEAPTVVVRGAVAEPVVPKPIKNVVIVLVDTLRADKLSPYNQDTRVKTPGLSGFLRGAAVMRNARSQENWTKPSVATLLSSLMPWQHQAVTGDAKVPRSVELLPELLRERGYYTGSFIANGYVSDKFGFKQGWNTYRNYIREGRRTRAQYVAADVLEWLDKRPADKPFLLYMHTIDPHVPYKPPKHFLSMYDADDYGGVVDFRATSALLEKIKVGSIRLKARDKERLVALYDAEISYHDVHFAAVMEGLQKRGLADETMVVVTSDHGEEFWDHGSVGHGHSVYDELLHVPLMIKLPGVTTGTPPVIDAVGLVDVMPTVLDALGEAQPKGLAGTSFLPQLLGRGTSAPRSTVSGFMRGWRTLGSGRYKLIQRTLTKRWLYDVREDPGESHDLADERPIALRALRGLLGLRLAESSSAGTGRRPAAEVHKRQNVVIDKRTKSQLEALGYVGTSAK